MEATARQVTELEAAVSGHSNSITTLETKMLAMKREMSTRKERWEDLEARSCCCNIQIIGVKEGRENRGRMTNFVANPLRESLPLEKPLLLDRVHQRLRSRPTDEDALPVLLLSERILQKALDQKPIKTTAGDKIAIFRDYTQAMSKQRAAFKEVRALLRGYMHGLPFLATLRITTPEGREVHFKHLDQAEDFIIKNLTPKED